MTFRSLAVLLFGLTAGASTTVAGGKFVLIGKDRDHPFATHEYMAECHLLAKCLRQTTGIHAVVSNGWPEDPKILEDVDSIVLYTAVGGNVLLGGPHRAQAEKLLANKVGLAAIHWSTGADEGEIGQQYLNVLGGWFNSKFSQIPVRKTLLRQADPSHVICRGWKNYELRDEYYIKLRFRPDIHPVLVAKIDDHDYTVGWTYERPDGGRSFGTVLGHFHDNFGIESFRRALVNGILWTAHVEVPAGGAPVAVTGKDLELPLDTRKK
jgi:type 1 glutamine amidotransferase